MTRQQFKSLHATHAIARFEDGKIKREFTSRDAAFNHAGKMARSKANAGFLVYDRAEWEAFKDLGYDDFRRLVAWNGFPGMKLSEDVETFGIGESKVEAKVLQLKGNEITIRIVFSGEPDRYAIASGHTSFTTKLGHYNFDRTGVEDSFYVAPTDSVADLEEKLCAQIAKVADARFRHERSETVPVIGFTVTPERKAELIAKLKAGKPIEFRPSGFGTGYRLSTMRTRFANRMDQKVAAFFGVTFLYAETMDCD